VPELPTTALFGLGIAMVSFRKRLFYRHRAVPV
jgi:hypothetical protein